MHMKGNLMVSVDHLVITTGTTQKNTEFPNEYK